MALVLSWWLAELVVALSAATLALYMWFQRGYRHWRKKGVRYLEPTFPFGNFAQAVLGQKSYGHVAQDMYNETKGERFVGLYSVGRPVLLVRDPDLVRRVLVRDFGAFRDRGVYLDDEEPVNRQLFFLRGAEWRARRAKLTPAFTSGKLRFMFQTIADCGRELSAVVEQLAAGGGPTEVRDLVARFTTDVIVSVGFGVESDSQRNPDAVFRNWGKKVFAPGLKTSFGFRLLFLSPKMSELLRVKCGFSDVSSFFRKMIADTVAYREENNVMRKDYMQLLIQLKNKGFLDGDKAQNGNKAENIKLTMDDLAAESFAFFIAGFETSTTTMSCALLELALNPDVQQRLQSEIDAVLERHGGDASYDAIAQMPYLDQVLAETLRKYPPLPILNRDCMEDYKIPDSDVVIEKGTGIIISLLGLHYDPEVFPDPERFDPERFSEEEKAKRHPYVYLPFGDGPRICIGMRLGQLQSKVGLASVLSRFSVRPTAATPRRLAFNGRGVLLLPTTGIQLRFEKRR
ncbi:cytochrome P450 6k1-like [Schistocerca piceifrons]|uniref:cytochrome P450 6k1-like n=1 Tax=Schistocerca piceifrons TaxID=274613 RepID=UPI001F5F8545|nr:cytochrome P450 6k1-like [Schistocerca piceifrons]